jgi:predicted nucleic acid-binding protein
VILVDSNVLIDLLGPDQPWQAWSIEATARSAASDQLAINAIMVAEVAPRLGSLDIFLAKLAVVGAVILVLSNEAAYAAGQAFDRYRVRRRMQGLAMPQVLPDFFIGGHAEALGASILTRDPRFYRSYFPTVKLITPETEQ